MRPVGQTLNDPRFRFAESDGAAEGVPFVASLSLALVGWTGLSSCLQGRAVRSCFSERESGPGRLEDAPTLDAKVSDVIFGSDRTRKFMLASPALSCNRRAGTCSGTSLGGVCGRLTSIVALGCRIEPVAYRATNRLHFSCTLAAAMAPDKSGRQRRSSGGRPPRPPTRELNAVSGNGGRPSPFSHEDGAGVASRHARRSVDQSPAAGLEPQRKRTTVAFRALVSAAQSYH